MHLRTFSLLSWITLGVVAPSMGALMLTMLTPGCAHRWIEGTRIRDTHENREIYEIILNIRQALEKRDRATLLGLMSPSYFETNGTPKASEHYGYTELKDKLLRESLDPVQEVYLSFDIYDIVIEGNRAHADIRYNTRVRLNFPSGALWDSHRDFNRLEFVREQGTWRIVRGL